MTSVPAHPDTLTPRVVRPARQDWVKFDAELARDGSVDPVDKALYAALASFVDSEDRDSDPDPDGEDVPTRAVLASCIGRSVDTVDRATRRLEERGLLRVERRRDPDNPRAHLPSVYVLLDYELWEERAAARAEARKAARKQRRPAAEGGRMDAARGSRTGAARGSRTGAARGGRMDAARGSRTGAAVPYSPEKISLSENARVRAETPERERETASPDEHEHQDHGGRADRDQAAAAIAAEWTAGTGLPRVPSSERKIREQAAELLAEGHDRAHLAVVARWMGQKGYRDLGFALTAKDAPRTPSAPSRGRPAWCGECSDDVKRQREDDDGRPYRCPKCHPLSVQQPALTL